MLIKVLRSTGASTTSNMALGNEANGLEERKRRNYAPTSRMLITRIKSSCGKT